MAYRFIVDETFKVIIKQDDVNIDEVGPFDSTESAQYWAGEMSNKYDANPTFVYPGEEPEEAKLLLS
jgi:hypothetical protein